MLSEIRPTKARRSFIEMLAIEDFPLILDFNSSETGIPLWPQIRAPFFRMLISDYFYEGSITGRSTARTRPFRALATMSRSVIHNNIQLMGGNARSDICLMTAGVANQLVEGRWMNRLSDYFALSAPDQSITIEEHAEWAWQFPRHHQRILFHAPRQAMSAVQGKLFRTDAHIRKARQLVRLVRERAARELDWDLRDEREDFLVDMLSRKAAALPYQYRAYQRMLEVIRPKVLLVVAGCYGPLSALIAAAKDMGITTAEYQHGAVSAGHDAYNFAPSIVKSVEYKKTLPDYFLGYGTWWNEQINAPIEKIAIGNPHRESKLSMLEEQYVSQDKVLVLSDGIEFGNYMEFALRLSVLLEKQGLRVCIRPHPLERTTVRAKYGQQHHQVEIDQNGDIYTSMQQAYAIVSEVSTGLFEAVGIVSHIYVWDTPKANFGYPNHPFSPVSTPEMLFDLLNGAKPDQGKELDIESIWMPHWKLNYKKFLLSHDIEVG